MSFLQPWAVWFLAGLPVIVLLYFLRLKRRTIAVSTHLFWQRVLQEHSRRALFQRLRHLFSLLLHLLIFGLLVAALARPLFDRAIQSGASTVLILDRRARMQATEPDGQTRFAKALALARDYARQAGGHREFALLTLDATATAAVPFTDDEKPLLDALESIQPTDATGDLAAALQLTDSLLASRQGDRRIVVLTDRVELTTATASPVTTRAVGTSRDNLAITRFATRPVPANPETSEVLLEIQNFSQNPANTDLELSFDGRPLEVKPLSLAPGERRLEILASVPRPGRSARGWLMARLSAADALALDNVAYAALAPTRAKRVLLVSTGSPFLEKLLAVDPGVKFQLIAPEAWQPALAPKFEAVIFDGTLPVGFDLAAAQSNYLFLKTTPFPTASPLEQPLITDVDPAHPATRNLSLQNVSILKAGGLTLPEPRDGWTFTAPLRSFEHALLITGERQNQRLAALAFDVLESDLPLRVAFPLLISNTLGWLAGEAPDAQPAITAGETITLADDQRMAAEPLTAPPKSATPPVTITRTFQPLRNGYYALTSGDTNRWLAVNTFSPAESDFRKIAGEPMPSASSDQGMLAGFRGWPVWQWLGLAALALFTGEWWLFHRRKTE